MTICLMNTFAALPCVQFIGNLIENYPLFLLSVGILTALLFAYYDKAQKFIEKTMKMRNSLRWQLAYKTTSLTMLGVSLVLFGIVFLS